MNNQIECSACTGKGAFTCRIGGHEAKCHFCGGTGLPSTTLAASAAPAAALAAGVVGDALQRIVSNYAGLEAGAFSHEFSSLMRELRLLLDTALHATPPAPGPGAAVGTGEAVGRILFVCDSCGEEVGDGEQNNGCCPHCGGRSLSPNGWCDDEDPLPAAPAHAPLS